MSKTKKLPRFVTVKQHRLALMTLHRGTVDAVMVEMRRMEERLRDEFGASRIIAATDEPLLLRAAGMMQGEDGLWYPAGTYEGNHLAPTPAEGAE